MKNFTKSNKVLILTHLLERYDIGLFIFYAPLLATKFFPDHNENQILYSTILFCSAYFIRPLGSIIFGFIGDTYGRKVAFISSVYLISVATLLISILPEFKSIGYLATIIIILARLLQGMASGGELTSVILLISESVEEKHMAKNLVLLRLAALIGVLCAGLVSVITERFMIFSWRFAFILGFIFTILNIFLRNNVRESMQFNSEKKNKNILSFPLKKVLRYHKKELIYSFFVGAFGPAVFYTTTVFFPMNFPLALEIIYVKIIILCFWVILTALYWKIVLILTPISLMRCAGVILSVFSILLPFINEQPMAIICLFFVFSLVGSVYFTFAPYLYNIIFETNIRHTGTSLGVSLGQGCLGGTAPFILTLIYNEIQIPSLATLLFLVLGVINLLVLKKIS